MHHRNGSFILPKSNKKGKKRNENFLKVGAWLGMNRKMDGWKHEYLESPLQLYVQMMVTDQHFSSVE